MSIIAKLLRRFMLLASAVMLLALLLSCDKSTSPQLGSLSGVVQLVNDTGIAENDPMDHSGVKVALYELAVLDTIVTNARTKYPSVGFAIDQSSEFDHRLSKLIVETTTDANGNFILSRVPYGTYNLVIMMEGWGYRNSYNIEVNSGSATLSVGDLALYPERVISGYFDGNISLEEWRNLLIIDDTLFSPESSLHIGPNAVVRINPTKKLDIMGSIETTASHGNMFRVTSNDCLDSNGKYDISEIMPYHSVNLMPSASLVNSEVSWGVLSFGAICLSSQSIAETSIKYFAIVSSDRGFWATSSAPPLIQYSIFRSLTPINTGMLIYSVPAGQISDNIIINADTGIKCEANSHPLIANNLLINNENGMQLFNSNSSVEYNSIRGSNIGIRVAGPNEPNLTYNSVDAKRAIVIGLNGYYANSRATINRNNLLASEYFYYVRNMNVYDIDAKNNYHHTTVQSAIESKTYHKPSYPESQQNQVCYVIYNPFAFQLIPTAGVQP